MRVQAVGPEIDIETIGEGIVRRFAGAREVERNIAHEGPQVEMARDELGPEVDTDRPRITDLPSDAFERPNDVRPLVGKSGVDRWRDARALLDLVVRIDPLPDFGAHVVETVDPGTGRADFCLSASAFTEGGVVHRRRLATISLAIGTLRAVAGRVGIGSATLEGRGRGRAPLGIGGLDPILFARQAFAGPAAIGLRLLGTGRQHR